MNNIVLMSHGSGGKKSRDLIRDLFVRYFDNPVLQEQTDSAILKLDGGNIAFTTDSYVVDPLFFPGGNIGKMAVCGTINDLSVAGAKPVYMSAGFILEEGFDLDLLETIVKSMADEAKKAGVKIVTGDTKVVERGKCDKIFINTSGIGLLNQKHISISQGTEIKAGDKIIINGFIGDHGAAIIGARNQIVFNPEICSDCASLNSLIQNVLLVSEGVRFMRDATRGGLSSVLNELVEHKKFGINLVENQIPIRESVKGFCEIFGFDPLYIANEGKVVMVVSAVEAPLILKTMQREELGENACVIGEIRAENQGMVIMETNIGGNRIIDLPVGEQLPRIC